MGAHASLKLLLGNGFKCTSYQVGKSIKLLNWYIEDIQIFGMNMPFISSSEAKNAYFMSGEATNEIYIFSLHEMK